MGRGAIPMICTRVCITSSRMKRAGVWPCRLPLKHETSFQGGDGYMSSAIARAHGTRMLATIVMDGASRAPYLPFYTEQNLSLDFCACGYQQRLFAHDGYRAYAAPSVHCSRRFASCEC